MRFTRIAPIKIYFTLIVLVLVGCVSVLAPKYIRAKGCHEYPDMLAKCVPFECTQTVPGVKDLLKGSERSVTVSRKILGLVKDPYYALTTCHTVEIDDLSRPEITECYYSDSALAIMKKRAGILFGTMVVPGAKDLDKTAQEQMRASYLKRSKEQIRECKPFSGETIGDIDF